MTEPGFHTLLGSQVDHCLLGLSSCLAWEKPQGGSVAGEVSC